MHCSTQALDEQMADCDVSYAVVVWEQDAWPFAQMRGCVTGSASPNFSRPESVFWTLVKSTRSSVLTKLSTIIWLASRKGCIRRI